ncbi:MAG TPA: alkaline phosphatase D family protein, partial [Pirellulaceae bacterium]|nr:alkaline phosphatase D family protein [Pirellulaceae bacterium]
FPMKNVLAMLSLVGLVGAALGLGVGYYGEPATLAEEAPAAAVEPHAGMGIMVGEVTTSSALAQVRLTASDHLVEGDVPGAAGVVEFVLRPLPDGDASAPAGNAATHFVTATAERDFIARASFTGLLPGTRYECATRIGTDRQNLKAGPSARFGTLPGADAARPVRFIVVTGMNYAKFHGDDRIDRKQHKAQNNTDLPSAYRGSDKELGYPALKTIVSLKPDFFVGTGDNVYYDTPTKPRAETVAQMRRKWHEQFVQPRYRDLFAAVPTYWEIDDHDYRVDDCDNTGDYMPTPEMGRKLMLEQLPYAAADAGNPQTFRTHRVSRDLQIWLVENRLHRSPNKMPDGPEKSIWGREQKVWLKRTIEESNATFKILISPTPMVGPDDLRKTDNHSNVGGFQHERDEFFAWLKENGVAASFYVVCGDRHWQYHSISPAGIEKFSCGALVDQNSRLGRKPGDKQSTDPDAKIRQPYTQDRPSGGFLLMEVAPAANEGRASLAFRFYDDLGKVLYECVKNPSARPAK